MKKLLIDSAYPEETRVALLENNKIQDFDRESLSVKQLKGNIYLAKITRIEPSLQSAFIDYSGDKHGFLPFADIHPDYYNIPENFKTNLAKVKHFASNDDINSLEKKTKDILLEENNNYEILSNNDIQDNSVQENKTDLNDTDEENEIESELDTRYKKLQIQDVLKEGQYLLVQVLKEERGNKGVALTTYISLAGKYCVLMTNNGGKGGVSKKILNLRDRKILKNIIKNLQVPEDRSIIIRTAGVGKKPEEILRDYIYLMKLWNNIKKASIESKTPTFIHAEDDVIKRCIRDLYNESVNEIIIEGEIAYKKVRGLLEMVNPNKPTNIKLHKERIPLFHRYDIEQQILELYTNKAILPSGGSIVIDQTEALVAIDVNSGKATQEKTVEEMAVAINIEATKEIARQLRLKDMAGLIVIDFIDMFDPKNRRIVERSLRDALMSDRARTQISRLSMFGLLEMSRQRLGGNLITKVSEPCSCCKGSGVVRSKEIVALNILRAIRAAADDKNTGVVHVFTSEKIALYMLNYKREDIADLEKRYKIHLFLNHEENLDSLYYIRKRKKLSEEERRELNPKALVGKVDSSLEKEYIDQKDAEKYHFNKNCYFNNGQPRKRDENFNKNRGNHNKFNKKKYNENKPKNNWFSKLFNKKNKNAY
jgi:ribonuclease E